MHLAQLREAQPDLAARNIQVAIVTYESADQARAYGEQHGFPWPMLIDAERTLYTAIGSGRASWARILAPRTILAYLANMIRGHWPGAKGTDLKQLGGDVLIDPEGIVRLVHASSGPADRPEIRSLLDAARP